MNNISEGGPRGTIYKDSRDNCMVEHGQSTPVAQSASVAELRASEDLTLNRGLGLRRVKRD